MLLSFVNLDVFAFHSGLAYEIAYSRLSGGSQYVFRRWIHSRCFLQADSSVLG